MSSRARANGSRRLIGLGALALITLLVGAWIWLDDEEPSRPIASSDGLGPAGLANSVEPAELLDAPSALDPEPLAVVPDAEAATPHAWPVGVQQVTLSGRVLDERGAAWSGAEVLFIADSHSMNVFPELKPEDSIDPRAHFPRTSTDASGRFVLAGPRGVDRDRAGTGGRVDPVLAITAEGMAWQGHAAAGFVGESMDVGDLILRHPGASFELRVVDEAGAALSGVVATPLTNSYQSPADDDPQPPTLLTFRDLGSTDADGRMIATNRWPGGLTFNLTKPGYDTEMLSVELGVGQHVDLGVIQMSRGRTHAGRVVDASGQAVQGATVAYVAERLIESVREKALDELDVANLLFAFVAKQPTKGLSDSAGRFVIHGLADELHQGALVAQAPGFRTALVEDVQLERDDTVITLQSASAWTVELRSALSEELISDGELRALQRTGFAANSSGGRNYNALIQAYSAIEVEGARVPDRGEVGVAIFAAAPGYLPQRVEAEALLPGEERVLVIRMEPDEGVRGRVLDERGLPVPDARVELKPAPPLGKFWEAVSQRTDADGGFAFPLLPFGTWSGRASKPGHADDPIDTFDSAVARPALELLMPRGARVHGTLLDAQGDPAIASWVKATYRAELSAAKEAGSGVFSQWARVDRHGRYAFPGLQPGDWLLESSPGVEESLSVVAGDDIELHLQLGAPLRLSGTVTSGVELLSQVRVSARLKPVKDERVGRAVSTRTEWDGRYELELATPGLYSVSFYPRGGARRSLEVEVVRGRPARLDMDYGTGVLAGRVILGAQVALFLDRSKVTLHSGDSFVASSAIDGDGRFHFEPLPADTYSVEVSSGLLLPHKLGPLELSDGERREDLELHLELGAAVSGEVRFPEDEEFDGYIHLRRADGGPGYEVYEVDSRDPWFFFSSLEPGRWRVDFTTFADPELGSAEGQRGEPGAGLPFYAGEEFTLEPGESRELELEMRAR